MREDPSAREGNCREARICIRFVHSYSDSDGALLLEDSSGAESVVRLCRIVVATPNSEIHVASYVPNGAGCGPNIYSFPFGFPRFSRPTRTKCRDTASDREKGKRFLSSGFCRDRARCVTGRAFPYCDSAKFSKRENEAARVDNHDNNGSDDARERR